MSHKVAFSFLLFCWTFRKGLDQGVAKDFCSTWVSEIRQIVCFRKVLFRADISLSFQYNHSCVAVTVCAVFQFANCSSFYFLRCAPKRKSPRPFSNTRNDSFYLFPVSLNKRFKTSTNPQNTWFKVKDQHH